MEFEDDRGKLELQVAHQVTWFVPDRPVDGGTLFLRPESDNVAEGVGGDHSGRSKP